MLKEKAWLEFNRTKNLEGGKIYGCITFGESYLRILLKTMKIMTENNDEEEMEGNGKRWIKGVSFQRNCGALVGEYNKVIWYYQLSW